MTANSIEAKIPEGLMTYFRDEVALPAGTDISYPGVHFAPGSGPYVRLQVMKNTPVTSHIGGGKEPIRMGFFMATVCWPISKGIVAPSDVAATIRAAFAYNTKIDHNGIQICVTGEPDVKSDMTVGAFSEIPVVIPWVVYP